jgi:hypothetical protein
MKGTVRTTLYLTFIWLEKKLYVSFVLKVTYFNLQLLQWLGYASLRLAIQTNSSSKKVSMLRHNSTGQSTSTTLRNPPLAHKHDSAGSPVI